jgi:hypothetical protein
MARIVRITWEKVQVNQSEYYGTLGVGGEAGTSAEWRLYFIAKIDGQERRWELWEQREVRDNHSYATDRQIDVMLDGELSIEVTAEEIDDFSDSDHIPGFTRRHVPEPGWETGGTNYRQSARNRSFDYAVHYKIAYISEGATLTPGHGTLFDVRYSGLWDVGQTRTQWSAGLTAAEVNAQAAKLWPKGAGWCNCNPTCWVGRCATTSSGL